MDVVVVVGAGLIGQAIARRVGPGKKIILVTRESEPAVPAAEDPAVAHRADLRARAKAEPAVQAVLDVFGGEIEDVEEL